MKKALLIIFLLVLPTSASALIDYTCNKHGGIDCDLGPSGRGFVMCRDGVSDESKSYLNACPSKPASTPVSPSPIYIPTYTQTTQPSVNDQMQTYCKSNYGDKSAWNGQECLCPSGYRILPTTDGKSSCQTPEQFCVATFPNTHYDKITDNCECNIGYEDSGNNCVVKPPEVVPEVIPAMIAAPEVKSVSSPAPVKKQEPKIEQNTEVQDAKVLESVPPIEIELPIQVNVAPKTFLGRLKNWFISLF